MKVFQSRDPWEGSGWRPATLNYYTYGLNNPVLYTDPSGNCPERDETCTWIADYLYRQYLWHIEDKWNRNDVVKMLQAALEIEEWFSRNGGGNAQGRMRGAFGIVIIAHASWNWERAERHHVIGNTVYLLHHFTIGSLIHEMGHILDNEHGSVIAFSCGGSSIWGSGPADEMARYIGQNNECVLRFFCRGYGETPGAEAPPTEYGYMGSSEDFADAFELSVLDPVYLQNVAPIRAQWMNNFAAQQLQVIREGSLASRDRRYQ